MHGFQFVCLPAWFIWEWLCVYKKKNISSLLAKVPQVNSSKAGSQKPNQYENSIQSY